MNVGRMIVSKMNCRLSNFGDQIAGDQIVRRSNWEAIKFRRSNCRRSNCGDQMTWHHAFLWQILSMNRAEVRSRVYIWCLKALMWFNFIFLPFFERVKCLYFSYFSHKLYVRTFHFYPHSIRFWSTPPLLMKYVLCARAQMNDSVKTSKSYVF